MSFTSPMQKYVNVVQIYENLIYSKVLILVIFNLKFFKCLLAMKIFLFYAIFNRVVNI